MPRFLAVLFLLTSALHAADIIVVPPEGKVQPNEYVILAVNGVTDEELPGAIATVKPAEGVQLLPAKTWGGAPIIIFKASIPGKYVVGVSLNAFRQKLDEGLAATEKADIDQSLTSELRIVVVKIGDKYQAKSGSALVEVAGTVPPPIDPVDPKPPITTKVTKVTYVFEKDNNLPPRAVAFALQRLNAESGGLIVATDFEEDSTVDGTPGGRTPSQYVVALKAAREAGLPSLVVQSGDTVVRVVKAPKTEAEVMEAVK